MRNIIIAFLLIISIAILISGCAVKEAKAPEAIVESPTVKSISSGVSEDINTLSETVDEQLEEVNFTLVDENLI